MIHKLKLPRFLNPNWVREMGYTTHEGLVDGDGVLVLGEKLQFANTNHPATDTLMAVWLEGKEYVCQNKASYTARIEAVKPRFLQAEATAKKEAEKARANKRRQEAESFNAKIVLTVLWDAGVKKVLSGLSSTSDGSGLHAGSVTHIYLLESLQRGRLKRQAGDFLCSSLSTDNGKRYGEGVVTTEYDGEGNAFKPKITCKSCLGFVGSGCLTR